MPRCWALLALFVVEPRFLLPVVRLVHSGAATLLSGPLSQPSFWCCAHPGAMRLASLHTSHNLDGLSQSIR